MTPIEMAEARIQQLEQTQEYLFKKHDADKAEIESLKKEAALQRLSDFTQEAEALKAHPVKELHLSLQKSKQTGELLAVTYTDDEHRIVEVLWQKPPVKELPTKEDEYWLMVEMLRAKVKEQQAEILYGKIMVKGYGKTIDEQQAEIEALGDMLIEEGIGVCQKYIDERIEKLRKAQEK